MPYPDEPSLTDFVDERESPVEIADEEHELLSGTSYSLTEVPHTEYAISCTGDSYGALTVSFTDASPASGHVYVNPLNGNVLHNAADVPDNFTWDYWGRGTANNEANLEVVNDVVTEAYQAAMYGWVEPTSPASQSVTVKKGNLEVAGKLIEFNGGTLDLSVITFDETGYTKQIRVAVAAGGFLTYSEGQEGTNKTDCETKHPPIIPESQTLAKIFLTHDQVASSSLILNVRGGAGYGGSGGGDDPSHDDSDKYTYQAGVVSGAVVELFGQMDVGLADGDVEAKVPVFAFVSNILDATYCTIKRKGVIDLSATTISYDSLVVGSTVWLSITAGCITQTEPTEAGHYWQPLGVAVSVSKVDINIGVGHWIKEGPDPDPDPGRYKYKAGVAHGELVYLISIEPDTVDEAKADSILTMPAIGVVTAVPGTNYCQVGGPGYVWDTTEHGGLVPGSLTPQTKGTVFYISVATEGEAGSLPTINPEHYVQEACVQLDDAGTRFRIICGPFSRPEPEDPDDGYDTDCDGEVGLTHTVYLDSNSVAHKTDARDDAKKDVVGIVKAVNAANNRCSIVRPPNVYNPNVLYPGGDYLLLPSTPGGWALEKDIIFRPGDWKVLVGWGRGGSLGGVLVDTHVIGKCKIPGEDEGGDDDPSNGRLIGRFYADFWINPDTWVELVPGEPPNYVIPCNNANPAPITGVVLDTEDDGVHIVCWVLVYGLHGSGYTPGAAYFACGDPGLGSIDKVIQLGAYIKQAGVGHDSGGIFVDPQPVAWADSDGGDPVPLLGFVDLQYPFPLPNPYNKLRISDGTNVLSKIEAPWDSKDNEWLMELPTVVHNIDFFLKSTGVGAGAFLELDLCRGSDDVSVLSTKAKLVTTGDGVRGDTLPSSGNSAGHTRAVIDQAKMPIVPGETLYVNYTLNGIFTTEPYGMGSILNKYGVRD